MELGWSGPFPVPNFPKLSAAIFFILPRFTYAMPRENRKRGKRAKDDADDSAKERAPQSISEVVEPEPTVTLRGGETGGEEEKIWPPLDPDTKAYFLGVNNRILELEDLGVGRVEAQEEDEEDGKGPKATLPSLDSGVWLCISFGLG
jgi:hypothetical protein